MSDWSHVWLFATPWTTADPMGIATPWTPWTCQAYLSITNSWSLLKFMSTESVMPSSHLILCCPLLLLPSIPASASFPVSWLFTSGGQSVGASTSASVLPVNIQNWFPLGLTGLISLLSKGLSRVFSSTAIQKHQFFGTQLPSWSSSYICTWLLEKPSGYWGSNLITRRKIICFNEFFLRGAWLMLTIEMAGSQNFMSTHSVTELLTIWTPRPSFQAPLVEQRML